MVLTAALVKSFDERIEGALARLGCLGVPVGAGVSGGADSTALLVSLCHIAKKHGFCIKAVTVNHNIREESETKGDAQSVVSLCAKLQAALYDVSVCEKTLQRTEVARTAAERGKGEEEAARFLRYKMFKEFAKEEGVKYIALAHNQNDQIETALMHFLTGSPVCGIQEMRREEEAVFVRPMLCITRAEIENYLAELNIQYRTDKTNYDERYFRNKIRHTIIPALDGAVEGWKKAVLLGAKKAKEDDEALKTASQSVCIKKDDDGVLTAPLDAVSVLQKAVKRRVVLRLFNEAGEDSRVPYSVVSSIMEGIDNAAGIDEQGNNSVSFQECYAGVEIGVRNTEWGRTLYAKKAIKTVTDTGFCAIINGAGEYETPLGTLTATEDGDGKVSITLGRSPSAADRRCIEGRAAALKALVPPLCVRSRVVSDTVVTAQGEHKSVAKLMSDWKVKKADRERIPIVTKCGAGEEVVCVWGSVLGYKDYLVLGGKG